jgi:S1-C subfamily serine protease
VLGFDSESGLGLLRVAQGLELEPLPLGNAQGLDVQAPVLVLTRSGAQGARTATVVSRRTFAGYWEYLLEQAIFTAPARRDYAGAALVDQELRLVGIGSLYVENAAAEDFQMPGNLFVPIDRLRPILGDLMESGRPRARPKPWLGVNVAEQFGRVIVTRVTPQSPAREAGLQPGDLILEVGGQKVDGIEAFYRRLWSQGDAGVVARLKVLQRSDVVEMSVTTRDRYRHYLLPGAQR